MILIERRLISLVALIFFVWVSIVFGLFIVFRVIFEISLPWQSSLAPAIVAVLRIGLGGLVCVTWLLAWWKFANLYLWKKLRHANRPT
jgi:hypothetical protein